MRLTAPSLMHVLAGALACTVTACSDRSSPVEPVGVAPVSATAQARPTDVDPTPFEIPAGDFCEFAFRVEPDGKEKAIELPGDRVLFLAPGLTWTITNLNNLNQETFRIPGAFHVTTLENGAVETVVTGRNILGDPSAGLVLAIGRFSFVFDVSGNLIQPLQGTGRLLDICELLT